MPTTETSLSEILTASKGISLSSILQSAIDIQEECEDFTVADVTSKNCYYNPNFNGLQFTTEDVTRHICPLTPYALSQLCGKLSIPHRYVKQCIEQGMPELAADNINAWMDEYHKNLFLRAHKGSIRGVLSDKYTTLDAPEILDVCGDTFGDDYRVRGFFISPERMHIRISQKRMMKIEGEDLFAGVTIDSSDVGRSTLCVRFFIYKQVCKNGLCISEDMGSIYTQRHVGIEKDEFYRELVAGLSRVPDLTTTIMDAIASANGYDKSLIDFNTFDEDKQERFVSRIRALTRLPEDAVKRAIETMYTNYRVSRWGFINSITEIAQDYSLERRLELESAAGKMLTSGRLLFVA